MHHKHLPERWTLPIGHRVAQVATVLLALFGLATLTSAATTTHAKSHHAKLSSAHSTSRHHSSKQHTVKTARHHGQHSIDEERTREIQTALIREHYLSGDPTGAWDQASKDAMLRYQAANGWQTKITPDSRALIKLGLGPDHKGLLNPETANIPSPHELGVDNETRPGGAADNE
ncbi:MAG TPA: peptidoglycan-binding protein [Bryobacteraceae bacterium]|nr:peptidoglycan-binding protein [Bryobacteraceae bacterium]